MLVNGFGAVILGVNERRAGADRVGGWRRAQ
jgi:hypothetical protein